MAAQSHVRIVPVRAQVVHDAALASVENLAAACNEGNLDEVKSLCRSLDKPEDVNLYNKKGLTPLCLAAYFGHVHVVDYLIKVSDWYR